VVLYLVGAGLGPGYQGDVVDRLVREADTVYVEAYTMPGADWLVEYARARARGRVVVASRSVMEEGVRGVVEEARRGRVVVLVAGDPLTATTHRSLIVEAARAGVPYRVVPGVSGVCASKSLSMLDYYKYGRTITVPGPWRMVRAYSIVEYILANACAGLHTLALLDIHPETLRQYPPGEAVHYLLGLAGELGVPHLRGAPVIVVERAGLSGERVRLYPRLDGVPRAGEWGEPASLAIPGPLGRVEREHLEAIHGVDPGPGLDREEACRLLGVVRGEA